MKTCIIAGSFDPFTLGHTYLVKRSLELSDRVVIAIGTNSAKSKQMLTYAQRLSIIRITLRNQLSQQDIDRVQCITIDEHELTAVVSRMYQEDGPVLLARGIRDSADAAYERTLERINLTINPELSVVYFMTPENLMHVSSTAVRHLLQFTHTGAVDTALVEMMDKEALEKIFEYQI